MHYKLTDIILEMKRFFFDAVLSKIILFMLSITVLNRNKIWNILQFDVLLTISKIVSCNVKDWQQVRSVRSVKLPSKRTSQLFSIQNVSTFNIFVATGCNKSVMHILCGILCWGDENLTFSRVGNPSKNSLYSYKYWWAECKIKALLTPIHRNISKRITRLLDSGNDFKWFPKLFEKKILCPSAHML